jgi:hypothetical protein
MCSRSHFKLAVTEGADRVAAALSRCKIPRLAVRTGRRRSLLPTLLASAAAAGLFVSGCGGPTPEERFAENVCATILPRAQEVLETYDDVVHTRAAPGSDARVKLWGLALRGTDITTKLRADLRTLVAPDTDAGKLAKGTVDGIARFAFERVAAEELRVRRLPQSLTLLQSIRGLDRLEPALIEAYARMASYDSIGAQIPEFKEPFEKADSCKELAELETDRRT